jgi:digeranylgeranylglycerophospholipid reductase
MLYDVAVVGAGPAGLMAALTASEAGLQTVLIERRKDIGSITRSCCQQLIMDEDFQGETVQLLPEEIRFTGNAFSVPYGGSRLPVPHKYFVSPGGRRVHFANADGSPIVIVIDKGLLLQGLLDRCVRQGVCFMSAAHVAGIEQADGQVSLRCVQSGHAESVRARKVIIAEGVNAVLTGKCGLNAGRKLFARALCAMFVVDGIDAEGPPALRSYMGAAYQSFAPVITGPALGGAALRYVALIGTRERRPLQTFQNVRTRSPLANQLESARVVKTLGCTATAYSALAVPHTGNILVAGDAAAYVEVEIQGALTCGRRAGRAVAREIENGSGFHEYARWWQESFEFNGEDYLQVAQGFALVPVYGDDEIDYLFTLIEGETLPGTYNQYRSPRLLWQAINRHGDRIQRERPELHAKIHSRQLSLSDML